ncbi:MFS transporter [Rhodopila sp.]|uniref:MFS transporter n=1 Tax=Rhodopila sp. TaxID=2480087 RepID=UPI003D0A8237
MSEATANDFASLDAGQLAALRRRAILSCAIGNFFELFDFTIYGYFAVAITRAFYPSGSMYGTYAAFGAAFLMRPVGAIVLGAYGDRMGRRAALVITIGLMAGATGAVGLIPTYRAIGYWAPILLVLCRLLQGFSTGGEWGGAAAFLVEYAPPGKRGLTGSWQQFSTQIGAVTGSVSAALLASSLSEAAFYAWGWRIPFLCGFLLGPIGYYLRNKVAETPAFERAVETRTVEHAPLRVAMREYGTRMIQAFGLSIIGCIANFIFVVYLVSYAINTMHLPSSAAFSCAVASGLVVVVLTPFVGALTDRVGRRPLILACALLNLVFDYPLFLLAIRGNTFKSLLIALICNAVFQALYTGTIPSILAEMFPTRVRYTALSVSYGFAVVLFGGFAPLISTWLVDVTGNPFAPAFYVMTGGALSAIAIISMKEYRDAPLE